MIEQLVNQRRNVLVDAAAADVFLIVGGRVGDVKIVAPAAVVLSVDAVERIGYDGERVRTQGGDAPGGEMCIRDRSRKFRSGSLFAVR